MDADELYDKFDDGSQVPDPLNATVVLHKGDWLSWGEYLALAPHRLAAVLDILRLRQQQDTIALAYADAMKELVTDVVACYVEARDKGEPYHIDTLEVWLTMAVGDEEIAQQIRQGLDEAGLR